MSGIALHSVLQHSDDSLKTRMILIQESPEASIDASIDLLSTFLPVELIDEILIYVMHLFIKDLRAPKDTPTVLHQFCSLTLTCRYFRQVCHQWPIPKSILSELIPRGEDLETLSPDHRCTTFAGILQSYQLSSIHLHTPGKCRCTVQELVQRYGNFHLNPRLTIANVHSLYMDHDPISVLLVLGSFIERKKFPIPPKSKLYGRACRKTRIVQNPLHITSTFSKLLYRTEDPVSKLDLIAFRVYSVQKWYSLFAENVGQDATIASWQVAPEVTEWWVWRDERHGLYFAGYEDDKAWIVDARKLEVSTGFGRKKLIMVGFESQACSGQESKRGVRLHRSHVVAQAKSAPLRLHIVREDDQDIEGYN